MTPTQRLALTGHLRVLMEKTGIVFENLATDTPDRALLASVNELHDRAEELLARAVDALTPPGAYAFRGELVELGPERTAEEDRLAQRYLEKRREEDGIASIIAGTASVTNSDRDSRGSAT